MNAWLLLSPPAGTSAWSSPPACSAGIPLPPIRGMAALEHGWRQFNERYAVALGVPASVIPRTVSRARARARPPLRLPLPQHPQGPQLPLRKGNLHCIRRYRRGVHWSRSGASRERRGSPRQVMTNRIRLNVDVGARLADFSHSRIRSRPVTRMRSPFLTETAELVASWRNEVIVYQLVSPSIHLSCDLSKRRWVEASRKLVIASPSLVVTARGSVPTIPVSVMVSDIGVPSLWTRHCQSRLADGAAAKKRCKTGEIRGSEGVERAGVRFANAQRPTIARRAGLGTLQSQQAPCQLGRANVASGDHIRSSARAAPCHSGMHGAA